MHAPRIPDDAKKSHDDMSFWFAEMSLRGLLLHPEDAPDTIRAISTGVRAFTARECIKLDGIMSEIFALYGDGMCEACHPIFMRAAGLRLVT